MNSASASGGSAFTISPNSSVKAMFATTRLGGLLLVAALLSYARAVSQQPSPSPDPGRPAAVNPGGPSSPVVHADGSVTFNLFAPGASAVAISGDYPLRLGGYSTAMKARSMTKGDHDVWSVTVGPMRNDLYAYQFLLDGIPILDPQNTAVTRDGARYLNWAIVPGNDASNYTSNDVPHGVVQHLWYPSPTLKMTRRMTVYTPPGYSTSVTRYPVLYLLHGGGGDEDAWTDMGRAPQILDNLIAQGKVVPMIVVMGNGNAWQASAPNGVTATPNPRSAPSGANPAMGIITQYPESIVHDILPFVDATFRTKANRDSRAIAGLSMGGGQTAHTAFTNVDLFSWVGLFSSAVTMLPGVHANFPIPADAATRRGPGLGETIDPVKFVERYPVVGPKLNDRLHLLYIGVGQADGLVESDRDLAKMFDDHGVKYTSYNLPDYGHDWNYWRRALEDFSAHLFKPTH